MEPMLWDLEALATETLERADLGAPVDPDLLAVELGLEVLDGGEGCEGLLIGRQILVDEHLRPERRAFAIAHEIGHFLARANGLSDSEHTANYLASALLLPREDFELHLRRHGWDLLQLRSLHRHASFEALARRIVALREARAFVFDWPQANQRADSVYSVPWGLDPSEDESLAAHAAVESGAPVEPIAGTVGWPVLQEGWARAITLRSL